MNAAITTYKFIIQNAPYNALAPLSQFNIGQAFEKQDDLKQAIIAYQAVVDKYPTNPAAADALYQIGFANMRISAHGQL